MALHYDRLRDRLFSSERLTAHRPTTSETHRKASSALVPSLDAPFSTPSTVGPSLHLHDISSSTIASTVLSDSIAAARVASEARARDGTHGDDHEPFSGGVDLTPAVTPAKLGIAQTPERVGGQATAEPSCSSSPPLSGPNAFTDLPHGHAVPFSPLMSGEGNSEMCHGKGHDLQMARMRQRLLDAEASANRA